MDGGDQVGPVETAGTSGSVTVDWIAGGHVYEFTLYPRYGPATLLASTTVTGILATPAATMSASPSTLTLAPGTQGTTVVSWNAPGHNVSLHVSVNGAGQVGPVASTGPTDSVTVTWITPGNHTCSTCTRPGTRTRLTYWHPPR
jgi:hypothetical protein